MYLCTYVCMYEESRQMLTSITQLKNRLSDFIEPDFGLLHELLRMGVLTDRQCDDIRSEKRAVYRRSEAVLDLLTSEDQCAKFLTALQRTGQHHVVNFITQNGGQQHNDFYRATSGNIAKLTVRIQIYQ